MIMNKCLIFNNIKIKRLCLTNVEGDVLYDLSKMWSIYC